MMVPDDEVNQNYLIMLKSHSAELICLWRAHACRPAVVPSRGITIEIIAQKQQIA
jgi:hypothetical protein